MNKADIKNVLKAQASSYTLDLRRKLSALYSGDNFLTDTSVYETLQKNTGNTIRRHIEPTDRKPIPPSRDIQSMRHQESESTSESRADIKKRIALLRGVSLPGDYLKKKV